MLVEHFGPEMYRVAAGIVGPDDARDTAQEAFITAWRDLPRLRDPERFAPWLRRIVVSRCRNHLRSRRRRPAVSLDTREAQNVSSGPDFRERVHARQALDGTFSRLSPDQRAVLVLHYGADLSIREAAEAMDISVGTAKSRLSAALAGLRRAMEVDR